jgi:hypothetical protein
MKEKYVWVVTDWDNEFTITNGEFNIERFIMI